MPVFGLPSLEKPRKYSNSHQTTYLYILRCPNSSLRVLGRPSYVVFMGESEKINSLESLFLSCHLLCVPNKAQMLHLCLTISSIVETLHKNCLCIQIKNKNLFQHHCVHLHSQKENRRHKPVMRNYWLVPKNSTSRPTPQCIFALTNMSLCASASSPVDLLEALRLISVTMSRDTWVVNCSRSENFSIMLLGGAFPNT